MLSSIVFNYLLGRGVDSRRGSRSGRGLLILAVVGNLGALIAFKYANFLADNLDLLTSAFGFPPLDLQPIHLPIGISFFTFQALSYVIDVHRGQAPVQRNPLDLALYISLFPQLIAGPIVRYGGIAGQLRERTIDAQGFAQGVERFTIGLAKKMMVANPAGAIADSVFALTAQDLSSPVAWLGLACYTIQIYFDFSGYSDMAIGLGRMFGFRFPENFNYPYISLSITEFWRRWHISLSSWFRDYLYIPLGGNRVSLGRTYANLLIVFVLCGFWHGASWNFLIWGLAHGALLVIERSGLSSILDKLPAVIRRVYVLLTVMIAWVFFRAETLPEAVTYLGTMFGGSSASIGHPLGYYVNSWTLIVLFAGILGSGPFLPWVREATSRRIGAAYSASLGVTLISILLLGSLMFMAAGTYNPFIYFRF
jgi:alginate O-acetyltransferase complex protein AlgI